MKKVFYLVIVKVIIYEVFRVSCSRVADRFCFVFSFLFDVLFGAYL